MSEGAGRLQACTRHWQTLDAFARLAVSSSEDARISGWPQQWGLQAEGGFADNAEPAAAKPALVCHRSVAACPSLRDRTATMAAPGPLLALLLVGLTLTAAQLDETQ